MISEIRLARTVLAGIDAPAPTVFFGGGTPTRLPAADLVAVLDAIRSDFGLEPGAEVTVEANPDDVTQELAEQLAAGGVTRVSMGMQSAVPATLALLERTHRAEDVPAAVRALRAGGIESCNVDLIYGTPGETDAQWQTSLEAALALEPDHISAYCLGIEPGTKLGARARAGLLPPVDPDEAADRYLQCDEILSSNGYDWYEVSNWSRPGAECRHNVAYWTGRSWWGAGPGAHSHVAGVRWWNELHPRNWTQRLTENSSPARAREVLDGEQRRIESIMLGIRLSGGLRPSDVGQKLAEQWVSDGLARQTEGGQRFALTVQGRLLADRLALQAVS